MDKIQNISLRQDIFGRFLNYGTIAVDTAATFGRNTFKHVNNPVELRKVVSEQMDLYKESQLQKQADLIAKGIKGNV